MLTSPQRCKELLYSAHQYKLSAMIRTHLIPQPMLLQNWLEQSVVYGDGILSWHCNKPHQLAAVAIDCLR